MRTTPFIRGLDVISTTFYAVPRSTLIFFIMILSLLWILLFGFAGLYNEQENKKFINQIVRVFVASTAGIATVIVVLFFKREFLFSSRFVILAAWGLAIVCVITGRAMVRVVRRILLIYQITARRVIVVGEDANTQAFIAQLKGEPQWGYVVVGKCFTLEEVKEKLNNVSCDEVIVTDFSYSREKIHELMQFCQTRHLDFKYAPDIFAAELHNVEMDAIAGFPLLEIKRTPLEGWGRFKKRAMDITVGGAALVVFLVPCIIIAFLIAVTSSTPIFVHLKRVGEGGKLFKLYKFRSMIKDAEKFKTHLLERNERRGPLFKMKNDPRITPLGRFLRRFSLDELPNFFNVLIGDMSLVGPRPHEPSEVEQYREYHKKLLNLKPGITGIAQISGRSRLDFDEEARLDLYYIENWNLKLDMTILLKTPFAVLFKREGAL